jgi:hypothetical protein
MKNVGHLYVGNDPAKAREEFIMNYKERFGVEPMSLEEELALPAAQRSIRNNKVKMMGHLDYMKQLIAALENRVRNIPEEDNAKHGQLVQDLEEAVSEASRAVQKAARVGYL